MNAINRNLVAINHKFSAVRVYDSTISPVHFKIKVSCKPLVSGKYEPGCAIIFQKVNVWMRTALDDVVILDPSSDLGEMIDALSDSNQMFLPCSPDDNVLIQAIDSKLKALAGDALEIVEVVLQSSDTFDSEQYWSGNDYFVDMYQKDIIHCEPWWKRDDCFVIDWFADDLDPEEIQEILSMPDPLHEMINSISNPEAEVINLFDDPK